MTEREAEAPAEEVSGRVLAVRPWQSQEAILRVGERHGCLVPGEADRNCRARRVPLGSPVESGGPGRHRGACFRAWLTGILEVWGCGQFVQNTKWPGLVDVKGALVY